MEKWKLPPRAKIYEALSAVADGRVRFVNQTAAEVTSSSRDKTYTVTWNEDLTQITSNDNASRWQGYLGYPIIAVLMKTGKISYHPDIAHYFSGIPWKTINRQFRNNYDKAVESVLDQLKDQGIDTQAAREEVDRISDQIGRLCLEKLRIRTGRRKNSPD